MSAVSATRTELLARRREVALAQQGRDVLEDKREQLLRELSKMIDVALRQGEELDRAAARARHALDLACAQDGPESVRSAAFASAAAGARFEVSVEGSSVMGVPVPIIAFEERARGPLDRGYTLAFSSASQDAVGEAFEDELRLLVRLVEADVRVRRVGEEIRRTNRRANALRHVVIPALRARVRWIRATLDEREREDHYRLKHLALTRARAAAATV